MIKKKKNQTMLWSVCLGIDCKMVLSLFYIQFVGSILLFILVLF